jgi:hypothetical protein
MLAAARAVISIHYRNRAGTLADAASAVRGEADLAEQIRRLNALPIPGLLG